MIASLYTDLPVLQNATPGPDRLAAGVAGGDEAHHQRRDTAAELAQVEVGIADHQSAASATGKVAEVVEVADVEAVSPLCHFVYISLLIFEDVVDL